MNNQVKPKVLDLFCGAGGMSWGLEQEGFPILEGIDHDRIALKTFARNHQKSRATYADLAALTPDAWLAQAQMSPGDLDLLIGGPPCQGFSKNVPRANRFLEDPRNLLIQNFLEFVRVTRPKIVIMENVAEIVNAFDGAFRTEILGLLSEWGYDAGVQVVDAAYLGVPQHRRRAFFFGSLCAKVTFPPQTHFSHVKELPLLLPTQKSQVTVWEAIGDLPSLNHGEGSSPSAYLSEPLSDYQRMLRHNSTSLYNHVARSLKPIQFERLSSVAPGEGAKELPAHLKPKGHYSGAYGRLTKDMVSPTLTRWMFHPGSGRYGHPVDIRTITIREAARLQSFSDDFVFEGSFTQASSQIGNAVPPFIMRAFANIIRQHLYGS